MVYVFNFVGMLPIYLLMAASVSLIIIYVISRSRSFVIARWLYVTHVLLFSFILVVAYRSTNVALFAFAPAYIASLLLDERTTVGIAALCTAGVIVIAWLLPGEWSYLPLLVLYMVSATVLSLLFLRRMRRYELTLQERTAQLMISEARLRAVLDGSLNALFILHRPAQPIGAAPVRLDDMQITEANANTEAMLGKPRTAFVGAAIKALPPDSLLAQLIAHVAVLEETAVFGMHNDVNGRSYEYQVIPLPEGAALSVVDVTERKVAAAQALELAVERERVGVLSRFINDASHDLMTPLTVMKTHLYLAQKATEPSKKEKYLRKMDAQVSRLQQMITSMLELVRLDKIVPADLETAVIDVRTLLADLAPQYQAAADARGQQLALQLPQTPLWVSADAKRMQTAVSNLIDNALKYSTEGGTVILSAEPLPGQVSVTITDYGVGIAASDLPHIFKRFYRTAAHRPTNSGAGLGLSITKRIVEAHQGQICVESDVDKGSVFQILLPAAKRP